MRIDLDKWKTQMPADPRILLALGGIARLLLLLARIIGDVVTKESGSFDHALLMAFRVSGDLSNVTKIN